MNGTCHKIVGTVAGATTFVFCAKPDSPSAIVTSCVVGGLLGGLGGLIPDLDKTGSKISKKFPIVSKVTEWTLGHRGMLHTPFFLIIFVSVFYLINKNSMNDITVIGMLSFFTGAFSHLFLDFLTPAGIMVLYPITKKKFHLFGLKNRFRDTITILASLLLFVLFITTYSMNV